MADPIGDRLRQGLAGAHVLLTGGRGGIGSEVLRLLSAYGAEVIVASRAVHPPPPGATACLAVDIGDPASIASLMSEVAERWHHLDILINCAGSSRQLPPGAIEQLEDALIQRVVSENLIGPLVLMREAAPLLRRGQNPVVVNLSSIAAVTGGGSNMAYAASKAGLDALSKAMARALAPTVRVVNVSPSALATNFVADRAPGFLEATAKASALGRLASTEEVAVAVLCAARLLTATTGVTVATDAGRQL